MAVCSLLPKSFPLLLCRDFIFTHLYHFHFCTGHLKSKFSVCKKCTILLNIKIRWERVCIANPHMYRYSIFLLTASNRIIFYFRQDMKPLFSFFPSITSNTADLEESIGKHVFILGCLLFSKSRKKTLEGSLHIVLLQSKVHYFFYNIFYYCMQYYLFWMRMVKPAVSFCSFHCSSSCSIHSIYFQIMILSLLEDI